MLTMLLRKNAATLLAALGVWLVTAFSTVNASTLEDVRFAELPGNRFEIRLDFDSLPAEPTGYTIEQPARIV